MITTQIDTAELAKEIAKELAELTKPQKPVRTMPASPEPFCLLRARLKEFGMDHGYFAQKLGIYPATLSMRMTGKRQWLLDEMYAAMDILHVPYDQIHEYFPKGGGISKASVSSKRTSA